MSTHSSIGSTSTAEDAFPVLSASPGSRGSKQLDTLPVGGHLEEAAAGYVHLDYATQRPLPESLFPVKKVVCVGCNYSKHVAEMQQIGVVGKHEAVIFMKPNSSLCHLNEPVGLPEDLGRCDHETELAILIRKRLTGFKKHSAGDVSRAIGGFGLALDLTLRDLQKKLKEQGQPWAKSKSFDRSCPITGFILLESEQNTPELIKDIIGSLELELQVNGKTRQLAPTSEMTLNVIELITYITRFFTLEPGDVVLTGTSHGVRALVPGDHIRGIVRDLKTDQKETIIEFETRVTGMDSLLAAQQN